MSGIDILINQIIAQAIVNHSTPRMPGYTTLLAMKLIAIISGVTGTGFLILALYHWCETHYSQQQTFIYMALALLAASFCASLLSVLTRYMRQKAIKKVGKNLIRTLGEFCESTAAAIEVPLRDHQTITLIVAALAGLLIGKKR